MQELNHKRFTEANDALRGFLHRLEDEESNEMESMSEGDLRSVSDQIIKARSQVGEASRAATLDERLQHEIAEYVHNFRLLQAALERMHCLILARKLVLDDPRSPIICLQVPRSRQR